MQIGLCVQIARASEAIVIRVHEWHGYTNVQRKPAVARSYPKNVLPIRSIAEVGESFVGPHHHAIEFVATVKAQCRTAREVHDIQRVFADTILRLLALSEKPVG